jgi:6-pyruvoyltetrahydropterin/6-carboxytetrahydropterin synthase
VKIFKRFNFDAAHRLPDWPDLHGHSYRVEVCFEGRVVDGYVIRESELVLLVEAVKKKLDHRYLNDLIAYPTSENIAKFVWREFAPAGKLVKVAVYRESAQMGVEYEGDEEAT